MAHCFQLFPIDGNVIQDGPDALTLDEIDRAICKHINIEVNVSRYGGGKYNWFDLIGWMVAAYNWQLNSKELKLKLDWYIEDLTEDEKKIWYKILDFMIQNYTSISFTTF